MGQVLTGVDWTQIQLIYNQYLDKEIHELLPFTKYLNYRKVGCINKILKMLVLGDRLVTTSPAEIFEFNI
jgi:hypothetical protein